MDDSFEKRGGGRERVAVIPISYSIYTRIDELCEMLHPEPAMRVRSVVATFVADTATHLPRAIKKLRK